MATTITDDCISCGACEPECPNNAIRQADPIYVIDPQLCTECVGFHDHEACAAVCPVDCCIPDPNIVETEEVLIARAKALHQDTDFGNNFPSRFRKGSSDPQPAAVQSSGAEAGPTPAAAKAVESSAPNGPQSIASGAGGDSNTTGADQTPAASAPSPNGEAKAVATADLSAPGRPATNAAPADANKPAAVRKESSAAAAPNGELKPATSPAKPVAEIPAAKDLPKAPVAKTPPAGAPAQRPKKTFANELPGSFQQLASEHLNRSSGRFSKGFPKLAVILLQPILGALPDKTKRALEAEVQSPLFTAAGSTGLNILLNAMLYPLICMLFAAAVRGPAIIFSQEINIYLLVGIALAVAEGVYRLKDGIVHLKSADEMILPAAVYGLPLALAAAPVLENSSGLIRQVPIPVDGFYSPGFVEKLERERRYGNVYTLEDRGEALLLRLEFPRRTPEIGLPQRSQLPDEMPDYDYDLSLQDRQFVVRGRCADERIRKLSSSIGAFPPEFTTVVALQEKVTGFSHHYENKCLQVLLVKERGRNSGRSHR